MPGALASGDGTPLGDVWGDVSAGVDATIPLTAARSDVVTLLARRRTAFGMKMGCVCNVNDVCGR